MWRRRRTAERPAQTPSTDAVLFRPPPGFYLGRVVRPRRDLPDELTARDDLHRLGVGRRRHFLRLLVHAALLETAGVSADQSETSRRRWDSPAYCSSSPQSSSCPTFCGRRTWRRPPCTGIRSTCRRWRTASFCCRGRNKWWDITRE